VYQTLLPGHDGPYYKTERQIAREYARLEIPAYWISLRSITGRPTNVSFNLFDSFDAAERAVSGIGAAIAANPKLARLQTDLLTHISGEQTILTVRRDDIVSSADMNLPAMLRVVRLTTLTALPGHEASAADALRTACAAAASPRTAGRCLVYAVDAGVPNPAFIHLVPLASITDIGVDIAHRHGLEPTPGGGASNPGEPHPDIANTICPVGSASVESQIYIVNPGESHMPAAFTAGDPDFWLASGERRAG